MSKGKLTSGDVSKEYCERWPDLPTMTLAKKLYNENREVYPTLEAARTRIRYYRGQSGSVNRASTKDKSSFKPLAYKYNPFDLPESHAESYDPFLIQQSKVGVLPDVHLPYHDIAALDVAINYLIKKDVNTILFSGDTMDMHWQSKHEKDPRKRNTFQEFEAARQFLTLIRNTFPKARLIFKLGNHEERWEKWLYVKAPEIFDDPEFTIEARLKFGELGIECVKDKLPIHVGKLLVLHGHELQGSGGKNPALNLFNKTYVSTLIGHVHKTNQYSEPNFYRELTVTNTMGCLCGLWPHFARINRWNHGFAYIDHDVKTGEYELENLKIVNGKAYR